MTYIYERIYSTDDYGRIFSARKLLGAVWGMCLGACVCVFAGAIVMWRASVLDVCICCSVI